ncbi:peptidase [Agaricicola taiwanensis]|uniref:Peptidase n=1 Tax=Agaricicola taiwanensis TaxID=591372 RepID=A0A8J2YK16_9RHOB|nr:Xaa-Pro peptidase family protein [Agaricicola taiwanensis]GGE49772.1 peptidase [Agaricicola taiwanensis]
MLASEHPAQGLEIIPFDTERLDLLMEEAGIDVLLISSKHNVQYMLGGHKALFFGAMDAWGISRYLPIIIYPKGSPEKSVFVAHKTENHQKAVSPFWIEESPTLVSGTEDAMRLAIEYLRKLRLIDKRIGIEMAFMPADAASLLWDAVPRHLVMNAQTVMERLRAIKNPNELILLREASERVVASMLAVITNHGPGLTKNELVAALRREETNRDLMFEYCLLTAGSSLLRAPSDQVWGSGDILSLDSGGNYQGYIGDVTRMGIMGEPDAELEDLLAEVEGLQQTAMKPLCAGLMGGDFYAAAESAVKSSPNAKYLDFIGHGMGLVAHEKPHLTDTGPTPYPADDARRPLEAGMVLSVETTMKHPRRGFIKLEDTVAVTRDGFEIFGPAGHGWNRGRY